MAAVALAVVLFCPPLPGALIEPVVPYTKPDIHQPTSRAVTQIVAPIPKSQPKPTGRSVRGKATWYDWHRGEAAAGPRLRAFLGSHWRFTKVKVCPDMDGPVKCITVRLTDWCACGLGRVIDLDDQAFRALAPLSRGVIKVKVSRT